MDTPLLQSQVPGVPVRRGKVRDVYDLGDWLVIVATDRLSAFDWVLPTPIPGKGRILTALTLFWLDYLGVPNHLLSTDVSQMGEPFAAQADVLAGRTMLVRKTKVVPFECVVRGYLAGSGWKDYKATRSVCGVPLPPGLREAERLPEPIFTPATKAESGHDENVSFDVMANAVGDDLAAELRDRSLAVYGKAADYAAARGIILADTKFEWGIIEHKCPNCGKPLLRRYSRRGPFFGCSGYPECWTIMDSDAAGNPIQPVRTGILCENCGSEMLVKKGQRGLYLACSGFPKCRSYKLLPVELKENPEVKALMAIQPATNGANLSKPTSPILLIDEVLTPDSSRFWPADQYQIGSSPPSFDKQYVRDWLETTGWDKQSPPPPLPREVVERTAAKYREAYERLVGDTRHATGDTG